MKKILLGAVAALALLVATTAGADWLRESTVHLKGLVFLGTSRVQLANAAGNLSTTSGAFSTTLAVTGASTLTGNVAVGGTLAVTGATTFRTPVRLASAVTGATAATGGDQATGFPIPLTVSLFSVGTVASSGDSVTLPTGAALGHMVVVENRAATNTLDVFPGASGAVNNKAGDAVYNLAAGKALTCYSLTPALAATNWACVGP